MTELQGGVFDRPIRIEFKRTVRKDDWTGEIAHVDETNWPLHARVWARRKALRGTERFAAQQFSAKVTAIYTLRHQVDGVTHSMRVNDEGEIYDITGIVPAERSGGGQELHCARHAD